MTPDPGPQLAAYIAEARWFGGKGREFAVSSATVLPLAHDVSTALVGLTYTDASGTADGSDLYQLPLASYDEPQERLAHAAIGFWDGRHHYDAVHDRDAMAVWLRAFAGAEGTDPETDSAVEFVRAGEHELDLEAHSTVFSGEQSNSSMAFGEDALLKVYRRLTPGINPDIEIHEALTRAGSTDVATLFGYVRTTTEDGAVLDLGMLQQFLRTASDGFDLALASARNLFTEGDLHADEVGGDFAAEAHRLGSTLAEVHALLAAEFGSGETSSADLAATMAGRLEAAHDVVPDLAELTDSLTARFNALRPLGAVPVQRIHGDLHLGQTLRTSLGWKLVDFEGEPAKDLAERRLPDSVWRDVAGMIRSLDYAASTVARDLASGGDEAVQVAYRAAEWTTHNTTAFLAGYTEVRGVALGADEEVLLAAYVADKAVYETVYETRNRPGWLGIPLNALGRLAEATR